MEVKKYNPFVVMNKSTGFTRERSSKTKPTGFTRERSSKTKPKTESKPTGSARERSSKTKLEARGLWRSIGETGSRMDGVLSLENKKKLDTIYAKGFVKTSRK